MGIFASFKGVLACLLQGIWNVWYPLYKPHYFKLDMSVGFAISNCSFDLIVSQW